VSCRFWENRGKAWICNRGGGGQCINLLPSKAAEHCRTPKSIVFLVQTTHDCAVMANPPWPHAPEHRLSETGTYFVTAATFLKAHHFRTPERLGVLQRGLLTVARDFSWDLEAWAAFSNHYHFVAKSPRDGTNARSLSQMLGVLHTRTSAWLNRLDKTPCRKVWYNFWDTKLTYQKSYLARLNYVHQNAVKHGLVVVANQYEWCSARWFEGIALPATVKTIYRFKIDRLNVKDEFAPIILR
jgi:putative transposase